MLILTVGAISTFFAEAGYAIDSMETRGVESRTPLVVLRFNVAELKYDTQLYNAVAEAIKVEPDVNFDVVGYGTGQKAREVVSTLNSMGVPSSRITMRNNPPHAGYEEVQIFVR